MLWLLTYERGGQVSITLRFGALKCQKKMMGLHLNNYRLPKLEFHYKLVIAPRCLGRGSRSISSILLTQTSEGAAIANSRHSLFM